ncbi:Calcium channel YVC1 [Neolecta irregularis DAH-3]|uniref:Calcium channel YVC1 n=1 Tax=Neolecta irregularis (strain DAH-3) TaxID=1198029 RepID=A0A1U7LMT0_NEOID|nr:Calcium channel YVC1 [Neolecta irregularis DAH-3]|eukprot:OLL23964.1 Calcium channel YVC1 [Neolecta irregularis DAH-3]
MMKTLLKNVPSERSDISEIIQFITRYINFVIDSSYSYDQLRTLSQLKPIIQALYKCPHSGLLFSTMWTCMEFRKTCYDEKSVEGARANAAEIVAIRLLRTYSQHDLMIHLTKIFSVNGDEIGDEKLTELSALDIAVIASAKHFLSSMAVRRIVNDIWFGNISFWGDIDVIGSRAQKAASIYRPTGDFWVGYSRLRVPRYKFAIETFNFVIVLGLYCVVLINKNNVKNTHLTPVEILLDVWFISFLHDEIGQIRDAGHTGLYTADVLNLFDVGMLVIFIVWIVLRVVGRNSIYYTELAFDVLSLEALFLIPRVFSALTLIPYYGALLTSLRQMIKDFVKFLVLISVLCAGFIFSFVILARNTFSFNKMVWMLIRIFYGSTYIGFDQMYEINPIFGPPLMLLFFFTSYLLLASSDPYINTLVQIRKHELGPRVSLQFCDFMSRSMLV